MKNENAIHNLEVEIDYKKQKIAILRTAKFEPEDKVLFENKTYVVILVTPTIHSKENRYDLSELKKDGTIPSNSIKPKYFVEENRLTLA